MTGPEARLEIHGHTVHVLGTVAGFVPDGKRVEAALAAQRPAQVFLGIPPEDVATLDALHDHPEAAQDMAVPDDLEDLRLSALAQWGETGIPSPDMQLAHAWARAQSVPLVAGDMNDADHTRIYTEAVKMRHIVQMNVIRNRLRRKQPTATDPYGFQRAWDAAMHKPKGLRHVEAERTRVLVTNLKETATKGTVVAVVGVAQFDALLAAWGA